MASYAVTSRYARALVELAKEQDILDQVYEDMLQIDKVCEENRDFLLMLRNPIIKPLKKAAIINALFEKRFNKLTISFLNLLAKKGRAGIVPEVVKQVENQYQEFNNIQPAQLVTAIEVDTELGKEFKALVREISGREKVILEQIVDNEIIGGYKLYVDDKQIDSSIKTKLRKIESQIIKS